MQLRWWARRLLLTAVSVALILSGSPLTAPGRVGAGTPVYPDLRAGLPPNIKLRFEPPTTGADRHWLIRFDGIT